MLKKITLTSTLGLSLLFCAIANAGTLYISWDDGYPVQNGGTHTPVTVNTDGTFVAGNFNGTWSGSGNNISLIQTGGVGCHATSGDFRITLTGSMLSSSPLIYGGSALCGSYLYGGGPWYYGSWTYQ